MKPEIENLLDGVILLAIFHKIFDNYIDTILLFEPRLVGYSLMADITIIFITGNKIFRSVLYK